MGFDFKKMVRHHIQPEITNLSHIFLKNNVLERIEFGSNNKYKHNM